MTVLEDIIKNLSRGININFNYLTNLIQGTEENNQKLVLDFEK